MPPTPPPTAVSPQAVSNGNGNSDSNAGAATQADKGTGGIIASHLPLPSTSTNASTSADGESATTAEGSVSAPAPALAGANAIGSDGSFRNHAIPARTMLRVLTMVEAELRKLAEVLQTLEMRFIGSSVLVVYEGDAARLEDALDRWEVKIAKEKLLAAEKMATQGNIPIDTKSDDEDEDEDEDDDLNEDEEVTDSDDDSADLDGVKEDAKLARRCPPFTVKMIDFAHTWMADGEGVDEGVLKGLETLRGLIRARADEVRASLR
jgi:1D-myo-inositol-tetrakisphosphate 5-kinase/inositol-polyphosphate multikinase